MKLWEVIIQDESYVIPGEGKVIDGLTATKIGTEAEKEGWNKAIDRMLNAIDPDNQYNGKSVMLILNQLRK